MTSVSSFTSMTSFGSMLSDGVFHLQSSAAAADTREPISSTGVGRGLGIMTNHGVEAASFLFTRVWSGNDGVEAVSRSQGYGQATTECFSQSGNVLE